MACLSIYNSAFANQQVQLDQHVCCLYRQAELRLGLVRGDDFYAKHIVRLNIRPASKATLYFIDLPESSQA